MKLRIKEARAALGKTQRDLAKALGISQPYLAQIERGERRLHAELQHQIGRELGVDPQELIDFSAPGEDEEQVILRVFRRLPAAQREVWLRMAMASLPNGEAAAENGD